MGSKMKPAIFSEPVASALRKWHHGAKKQLKSGRPSPNTTPFSSRPASPMHAGSTSPAHLLRGYPNYSEHNSVEHRGSNFGNMTDEITRREGEIEADVENPRPREESLRTNQDEVQVNLSDFSFRRKEKLSSS